MVKIDGKIPPLLANFPRMLLVCMICTVMCGNGCKINTTTLTKVHQLMAVHGNLVIVLITYCVEVAGGTTPQLGCALLNVANKHTITGTRTSASV